jgi:bacillopeptidase F (M6 metalloprotease family)
MFSLFPLISEVNESSPPVNKSSCRLCRFNNGIEIVLVGKNNVDIVVGTLIGPSFLRNFDANATATHEHCIANAKKSIRNNKLRRTMDEFDFVKNSFKKAGTRHTAFIINKLLAASSFGNI